MFGAKMINRLRLSVIGVLVIFCFGAAGEICGGAFETTRWAFESSFRDNSKEDVAVVLNRLDQGGKKGYKPSNTAGIPIAVFVTRESPRSIIAFDLNRGVELWKVSQPIRSQITLGGDLAIFQSGNDVVAYHATEGRLLWQLPIREGWKFLGADVEGDIAVISVGIGGTEPGDYADGQIIALKAQSGSQLWEHNSGGGLLGEPAIYNQTVFVPWDRQKLAVLEADKGKEICRILATDYTMNYIDAEAGGVYFGSLPSGAMGSTIIRFNEEAVAGKREGSTIFTPNLKPIPGDPAFKPDAFSEQSLGRAASGKISLHWRPVGSHPSAIAMMNGQYYLHYWRYLIAFDSTTSQVRWSYRSKRDIEGVAVVKRGLVGIDSSGRLFFLDSETGSEIWSQDTGANLLTASIDASGFHPGGGGKEAEPPHVGLSKIVWDKDNRMLPIRSYAVSLLADIPVPEITRDLLKLYGDGTTPAVLRDQLVKALEKRSVGAEYLVEALDTHYDFLAQTESPPMGIIAPAIINMKERSAVPALLAHLMDHETPVKHLHHVLAAIIELGDASVLDTLKNFLTLYHADSLFLEHEYNLAKAAEGVLKFGEPAAAEKFVTDIRDNNQTLPELQFLLSRIIEPLAQARVKAKAKAEAEARGEVPVDKKEEQLAHSLSHYQISDSMQKQSDAFRPCVAEALKQMPSLRSVRLRFVVEGATGKASGLRILPDNITGLGECLSTSLEGVTFPRFRATRQTAAYTITIQ